MMRVGHIREAIAGIPDETEIQVEIMESLHVNVPAELTLDFKWQMQRDLPLKAIIRAPHCEVDEMQAPIAALQRARAAYTELVAVRAAADRLVYAWSDMYFPLDADQAERIRTLIDRLWMVAHGQAPHS